MNEKEKINILIVDDRPENLLALENLLESPELNIIKATSGNEALGRMLEYDFALVLLDVQMPEMDGFETAELMRGSAKTRHVPIIFVTAISKEEKHIFKGYDAGAVDYLFKPLDPHVLKSKVNVFLQLYSQKKSLEKTTGHLRRTVEELKKANQMILEQQKSVIEEERLKVLLQMAGATAHELNQPLMVLLGNIELMGMNKDNPEKTAHYVNRVEESGQKISEIVRKIQTIRHDETKAYLNESAITEFDQKIRILLVEDSDGDFETISRILKDHDQINLHRARGIEEALHVLEMDKSDLVFSEYILPDGNGLDFLGEIEKKGDEIPVVIISGQGDEMIVSQVIQAGAYDYLSKTRVNDKSLSRIIANTLEKSRFKRETREVQKKLAEMSTRDELTGLYNRRYFMEALEREVARAKRYETALVLCMLDLDYFKHINDTYGHPAGDMVLSEIGKMLKKRVRESDLTCRYGGEEFTIILPNTEPGNAFQVCDEFRGMVAGYTFKYVGSQFQMTLSIGIAGLSSSEAESADELIALADRALYQAKERGRNRVVLYESA